MEPAERFLDESRFWVQRVLVPLLVLVGVSGNVVTVVVLTRRGMRCSTNVYLTALAVVDVVYLLFVLLLSFEHYPHIHDLRFELYWRFYGINRWLVDAASSSSVWLTVSFTVERYIAVCHPMRGKVMCTERRAKRVIAAVVVLCLLATATTSFEYQLTLQEVPCAPGAERCAPPGNGTDVGNRTAESLPLDALAEPGNGSSAEMWAPADNGTRECCAPVFQIWTEPTALGVNPTYTTVFYWFTCVTFTLLPLVLLATLNCVLVNAVRRSRRHRRRLTKSRETGTQRQENRMTVILIAVVILFLTCQTPTAGLLIYTSVYPERWRHQDRLLRALGNVFNMLVSINAACNFLLYCALSSKYRRTFRALFCGPDVRGGASAASDQHNGQRPAASSFRSASVRVASPAAAAR